MTCINKENQLILIKRWSVSKSPAWFKIINHRKGGLTCRGQVLRQVIGRVMKRGDQSSTLKRVQSSREILQFAQIHVYRTTDSRDKTRRADRNANTDSPKPHFSPNEMLQEERENRTNKNKRPSFCCRTCMCDFISFQKGVSFSLVHSFINLLLALIVSASSLSGPFSSFCNTCNRGSATCSPTSPVLWG